LNRVELDKTSYDMLVFKRVDMLKGDLELIKALEANSFLEVERSKANFLVWDFLDFIVQQFERKNVFTNIPMGTVT